MGERLVGHRRRLDLLHHLLDVIARDRCRLQLGPARQGVTADERLGLRPGSVMLLGVFLDITLGEIGKCPSTALGLALGHRVATLGDGQHRLGGQPARVAQCDGVGVAEIEPARATVAAIDRVPAFFTGRLYTQRQPVLVGVPDQVRARLRAGFAHGKLGETALTGCVFRSLRHRLGSC
jgi:hypothetical protein